MLENIKKSGSIAFKGLQCRTGRRTDDSKNLSRGKGGHDEQVGYGDTGFIR